MILSGFLAGAFTRNRYKTLECVIYWVPSVKKCSGSGAKDVSELVACH